MSGDPTSVGPGVICRVRLGGGLAYATCRMTLGEAKEVAANLRARLRAALQTADVLVDLPADGFEEVSIPAAQVKAIEVVRVNRLREAAAVATAQSAPAGRREGERPDRGLTSCQVTVHDAPASAEPPREGTRFLRRISGVQR